jgi:hypothetical protein
MTPDPATPTVSVSVPAACLPDVVSALTVFLLRGQYAFLQTFDDVQHTRFDIDAPAQGSGMRLHVQTATDDRQGLLVVPPVNQLQSVSCTALIQHLQAVCTELGIELKRTR